MAKARTLAIGTLAGVLALALAAGPAYADFSPKFTVSLSDTKIKANPQLTFHLEFDRDDEEIGSFTGFIPRGFNIAPDEAIANNEEIGAGQISIAAGPGCRPGSPVPDARQQITVNATFFERDRTDEEADSGVHAVWFLDIEPVNRVRLIVTGSKTAGWTVSGAPTPSDNTCNPLTADLNIYPKSESGVAIITNPARARPKKFKADIASQDSPAIAHFEQIITITQ